MDWSQLLHDFILGGMLGDKESADWALAMLWPGLEDETEAAGEQAQRRGPAKDTQTAATNPHAGSAGRAATLPWEPKLSWDPEWDIGSMKSWRAEGEPDYAPHGPVDEDAYIKFLKQFGRAALTPEGKLKRWWEFGDPIFKEAARYVWQTGHEPGRSFPEFHRELERMRGEGKIGGPGLTDPNGRRLDRDDAEYKRIWQQYDEEVARARADLAADNAAAVGIGAGAGGASALVGKALGKGGGVSGVAGTALGVYGSTWWNAVKFMQRELEARERRDAALAEHGYPVPPRPNVDEALADLGRRNMNF